MITKIEISYPEFGLKLDREFTPGINLIEEANGYGKSTILNTILSLYSKKYPGLRTLPAGTAKITTPDKTYMLSKGVWVGLEEAPNDLVKYILPGEFFSLSTPAQRSTLVKLLGIDYDAFMKDLIPEWHEDLASELKANLKSNEGKEEVILSDITRLKSIVVKFEKNPIVLRDTSADIEREYSLLLRKHNESRMAIQNENFQNVNTLNRLNTQIDGFKKQQQELRDKYAQLKSGGCPTCHGPMVMTKEQGDAINMEGQALGEKIKQAQQQITQIPLSKEVPEPWPERDLEQKALTVELKLEIPAQADIDAIAEYNAAVKELKIKTDMLKELGELDDRKTLDAIDAAKKSFTADLQEKVNEFGLEIELFKEQGNGKIVESFIIMKDGKPYSELSGGNRLLVQIRLAMIFVKKLGLDFILIDEAGMISQNNFDLVKQECDGVQVIMARATPFSLEAEKAPKKKK